MQLSTKLTTGDHKDWNTEQRFNEFAELNIEDVACDVLLGLQGTTPEQMLAEITTIVSEFRPAVLDIFMVTPTYEYVNRHFSGDFSQILGAPSSV